MTAAARPAKRPATTREHGDLWGALYHTYAAELTSYMLRHTPPPCTREDAHEAVADAFAQAGRHLPLLADLHPKRQRAWLYRVAINNMTDSWRHTQYTAHPRISLDRRYATQDGAALNHKLDHGDDSLGATLADEDAATDPDGACMAGELLAALEAVCQDRADRVILHSLLSGMGSPEIAPLVGITRHSTSMRILRLQRRWLVAVERFDPTLLGCVQVDFRAQAPELRAQADARDAREAAWQAQRAAPGGKKAGKKIRLIDRKRQAAQKLARAS